MNKLIGSTIVSIIFLMLTTPVLAAKWNREDIGEPKQQNNILLDLCFLMPYPRERKKL